MPSQRPSYLRSLSSKSTLTHSPKDKPRLYITLYPRGSSTSTFTSNSTCDSYHWTLTIGPQTFSRSDTGTRYHVTHSTTTSSSHGKSIDTTLLYTEDCLSTTRLARDPLVRICIAKIIDLERLETILRSLPIPLCDSSYSCLTFVRSAFTALHHGVGAGCLKSYLSKDDWKDVELCVRKYCKRKREQRRFTGDNGSWNDGTVSTFNYWENREVCA